MTLFDILESWSKDDIEQLNSVLRAQERKQVIDKEDEHDEEDSVHEAFLLSDKAYTRFVKILDRGVKIPEPFNSVQLLRVALSGLLKKRLPVLQITWFL